MENIEFEEKSVNKFGDFYKKPRGLVNFLIEKKILKDEKINYLNPRIGFIVYKKESPTRVRAKWINYN
jgi:hypothetical protein